MALEISYSPLFLIIDIYSCETDPESHYFK